jgi:hypothetical protein
MNEEQQPATKADVTQLRADVTQMRADLTESENRLIEHLRHIETSLLTAFHNYAQGVNVRFRKIEADVSNLDTATLARMDAFEQRVLALEMRLPPSAHQ